MKKRKLRRKLESGQQMNDYLLEIERRNTARINVQRIGLRDKTTAINRTSTLIEELVKSGDIGRTVADILSSSLARASNGSDEPYLMEDAEEAYAKGHSEGYLEGQEDVWGDIQFQFDALQRFAEWVVTLHDVDGQGFEDYKTVNLTKIIERAKNALEGR